MFLCICAYRTCFYPSRIVDLCIYLFKWLCVYLLGILFSIFLFPNTSSNQSTSIAAAEREVGLSSWGNSTPYSAVKFAESTSLLTSNRVCNTILCDKGLNKRNVNIFHGFLNDLWHLTFWNSINFRYFSNKNKCMTTYLQVLTKKYN